jgi:hypothetical protein
LLRVGLSSTITVGVTPFSEIETPLGVSHFATVIFTDDPSDNGISSCTEPFPND